MISIAKVRFIRALSLVGSLCWATSVATAQSLFMGLGDLEGGVTFSQARAVSADGSVVVGVSNSGDDFPPTSHEEAFR
ncbi:MAG: hypothetical protein AAF961_16135, partial [Planctomycetota bacterium]